jgi:hypothetical protein
MISPVSASGVRSTGGACGTSGARRGDGARAQFVHRQGHGVLAEALLGDEGLGGGDQFLQVLDAVGAFLLGAVEVHQAGAVQHVLDDLAQRQALGLVAHAVDQRIEAGQVGAALAAHRAHALPQAAAGLAGGVLQLLQRAGADAAGREVDHPQEAGVVVAVLDQAQIGQRVLDFGPLEEAQAAVDAVGDAGVEQRRFDHPRLGVAAVEDGDLVAAMPPRCSCWASSSTHWASAKSLAFSCTRTGSPGPASVRRFLPRRWLLWAISALAASRMLP